MKRKLLTVLLSLVAVFCLALGLTACGRTEKESEAEKDADVHTHAAEHFQVDDEGHWKICTVCGEKFSVGDHDYNAGNACKTCGFSTVYTKGLDYVLDEETNTYAVKGIGEATNTTDLIVPAYYEGKAVTAIGDSAFSGRKRLASIKIPGGVTLIGDSAFISCSGLTSVEIPDGVTSIGEYAFYGCTSLSSITIPDSVTEIKDLAFCACYGLKSIKIGKRVTHIGWCAFADCSGLTSITIPDSVTEIDGGAFDGTAYYNDASHWDVSGVLYIGKHLIAAKDTIFGAYTVRQGTKTIAGDAFRGKYLNDAYTGCPNLTSITIPDSVTSIGSYVFEHCSGLTDIQFKGTIKEWQAIQKGRNWDSEAGDYTVTCTDGTVAKDGTVTYFNAQ